MKIRLQARQEGSDGSSSASSSSFHAGRWRKRRRQRKSHSRDMPRFVWNTEDHELLLEACKQNPIVCLARCRPKKNLHKAIVDYMNSTKEGLNLKPEQIKSKLKTFEKLWKAYQLPRKGRGPDFAIIEKYREQFMLLFDFVPPSDSLPMSCQSAGMSRQTPESSGSCDNLHAALRYIYDHGCKDHKFMEHNLLLLKNPDFLVGFFVLPTYEERISYLEYMQNQNK